MSLQIQKIVIWIVTAFLFISGNFIGVNHFDTTKDYIAAVDSLDFLENTRETAIGQVQIYDIITNHLNSELPAGKTEKKVLVIGYDGCRLDTLSLMKNQEGGAIQTLMNDGGKVVASYCGGVNYPYINTQDTSTAPGWCSMLTGQWADVHGITKNYVPKSNDHLTLLTTLVEDGTVDSSAFYVSWGGHFNSPDCTYWNEKTYTEEKGINTTFLCAGDDDGTYNNVKNDLQKDDCTDFIFSILEYCDHEGHTTGFGPKNKRYCTAFDSAQAKADELISAVKARPTYDSEDWLILITADHGGFDLSHGNMTMQERYTFIASNKDFDYTPENQSYTDPTC
ncbi:MAG: alkaline phosphatase family protein [Clostridia bacterium]|nr:alkaline phosphatase family protein [Clostridia bacterium]